jgi:ribosomal protein L12E/L44/L45/RPP1/RPP2
VPPTGCWLEILTAAGGCLRQLQPEQVVPLARDVARLQPPAQPPPMWLSRFEGQTREQALRLEPAQQVVLLASWAVLGHRPEETWAKGLAQSLLSGMARLQPAELAVLTSSVGQLQLEVDEGWMQQLVQQLEQTCLAPFQQRAQEGADAAADGGGSSSSSSRRRASEQLSPWQLHDIISGLCSWESHPLPHPFLASLQQAAAAQGPQLPATSLAQLLHLQAVNGFSPEASWLEAAQQQACRQLQFLGLEDVLRLLIALAIWTPAVQPELLQGLLLLTQHLLPSLAPQQCASALSCLLRLGAQPPQEWVSTLGSALARKQAQLTPDVAQVRQAARLCP